MFGYKGVTVLSVGSEELGLFSFDADKDGHLRIKGALFQKYSGYQDGEFLCVEEIYPTVKKLIESFQIKFKIRVKKLAISIPGEFSCVVSKNVELDIDKRIKQEDIDEMFFLGDTYRNHNQFVDIDRTGVFFKTNCNPQKLINPLGQSCERVIGKLSYILSESYFYNIFMELSTRLNIKVRFVSSLFCCVKYLNRIKNIKELSGNLYLDLGYLSSSIAYSMGKGIMYMRSFSLGGGSVAGDITIVSNIPFSHSYALYKKLNLNLLPKNGEVYTIFINGESYCYDIRDVNAIAEERVYNIANYIKAAIDSCSYDIEKNIPLFIGGSTLCSVPGVKEIIENVCGRTVEVVAPDIPGWESTEYFSPISVVDALRYKSK